MVKPYLPFTVIYAQGTEHFKIKNPFLCYSFSGPYTDGSFFSQVRDALPSFFG